MLSIHYMKEERKYEICSESDLQCCNASIFLKIFESFTVALVGGRPSKGCALQRDSYFGRVHRARMTYFSAAKRREDVDETAARGVMGTRRRGGGAFQPWVKPEVDPP